MCKKIFLITVLFSALIFAGCGGDKEEPAEKIPKSENGTAFRNGDLFTEDIDLGDKAVVEAGAPGSNESLEKSFTDAPPMIPHKTDGFVPITAKSNMCITCHMPDKAVAVGATAIPATHFTNYRPEIKEAGGKVKLYDDNNESNSTVAKDLGGKLSSARYNCNQCHATQTNAKLVVKNNF